MKKVFTCSSLKMKYCICFCDLASSSRRIRVDARALKNKWMCYTYIYTQFLLSSDSINLLRLIIYSIIQRHIIKGNNREEDDDIFNVETFIQNGRNVKSLANSIPLWKNKWLTDFDSQPPKVAGVDLCLVYIFSSCSFKCPKNDK